MDGSLLRYLFERGAIVWWNVDFCLHLATTCTGKPSIQLIWMPVASSEIYRGWNLKKYFNTIKSIVLGFNLRTLKQNMWFMSYCSLYSWMYAWIWFLGRLHVVVLCFVLLQISLEIDTCLSAGNVIFVVVVVCSCCSTVSANSTKNKQMLDS